MAATAQSADLGGLLRAWWPLLLGNLLEWYEFGVYGYLAKPMGENFFHGSDIGTWIGFAITFLLRPVGGICFGCFADMAGRRKSTVYSMLGMLIATVGQGLLPGRVACGQSWATVGTVLLCVLRGLQGLATGGEIGSLVTYFAETAPKGTKSLGTAMFLFTAVGAFVISSSFVASLYVYLGEEAMLQWGWRIPFLAALVPGLLTMWGRSRLPESPEFMLMKENQEKAAKQPGMETQEATAPEQSRGVAAWASSVATISREHGLAILIGYMSFIAIAGSFYMGIWCSANLLKHGLDKDLSLLVSTIMNGLVALVGAACGWATDRYLKSNPLYCMTLGQMCLAVVVLPVFLILKAFPGDFVAALLAISGIFGAATGVAASQAYLWSAELFPTRWRALGFGLTFNLAICTVGGTASIAAEALDRMSPLAPGIYLQVLALVALAAMLIARRLQTTGRLPRYCLDDGSDAAGPETTKAHPAEV